MSCCKSVKKSIVVVYDILFKKHFTEMPGNAYF